jgi:hypothetical protein
MSRNLVPTAAQGIIAGLILYLTVAALFAGVDLLTGRSLFHTFHGPGEPLMATRPVGKGLQRFGHPPPPSLPALPLDRARPCPGRWLIAGAPVRPAHPGRPRPPR